MSPACPCPNKPTSAATARARSKAPIPETATCSKFPRCRASTWDVDRRAPESPTRRPTARRPTAHRPTAPDLTPDPTAHPAIHDPTAHDAAHDPSAHDAAHDPAAHPTTHDPAQDRSTTRRPTDRQPGTCQTPTTGSRPCPCPRLHVHLRQTLDHLVLRPARPAHPVRSTPAPHRLLLVVASHHLRRRLRRLLDRLPRRTFGDRLTDEHRPTGNHRPRLAVTSLGWVWS